MFTMLYIKTQSHEENSFIVSYFFLILETKMCMLIYIYITYIVLYRKEGLF